MVWSARPHLKVLRPSSARRATAFTLDLALSRFRTSSLGLLFGLQTSQLEISLTFSVETSS
jgi:hypothetical protein